jgi:hypothetical protein
MSATDDHVTQTVRSWIAAPEAVAPEEVLTKVLANVEATPQRQPGWRLANILPFDPVPMVAVAVAAAGVVLLAFLAGSLVPSGGTPPGAQPSASASPTAAPTPGAAQTGQIKGLPPEGSVPSSTQSAQLIVRLESTKRFASMWIYADGRVITSRGSGMPAMGDAYIGLIERHLTPDGADLLRRQIIETGLFDDDLNLARDGGYGLFLQIGVENGGKFVRATWAVRANFLVGSVTPVATAEQAQLLGDLEQLLSTPSSWPASAWADSDTVAYVPSHYAICFRGFPTAVPQWRVLDALPTALGTLLRNAPAVGAEYSSGLPCALLSTDDARTLAVGLEQAQVPRDGSPDPSGSWVRYLLDDPASADNVVWISFEPVLPDGVATWLGPG